MKDKLLEKILELNQSGKLLWKAMGTYKPGDTYGCEYDKIILKLEHFKNSAVDGITGIPLPDKQFSTLKIIPEVGSEIRIENQIVTDLFNCTQQIFYDEKYKKALELNRIGMEQIKKVFNI